MHARSDWWRVSVRSCAFARCQDLQSIEDLRIATRFDAFQQVRDDATAVASKMKKSAHDRFACPFGRRMVKTLRQRRYGLGLGLGMLCFLQRESHLGQLVASAGLAGRSEALDQFGDGGFAHAPTEASGTNLTMTLSRSSFATGLPTPKVAPQPSAS